MALPNSVNTQLPLPAPSGQDGHSIIRTLVGWANGLVQSLLGYGDAINQLLAQVTTNTTNISALQNVKYPKVHAHASAAQSIPTGTWTKLTLDIVDFDTNSNFAASRFTPTVAGYYHTNTSIAFAAGATNPSVAIYKNGVKISEGQSGTNGIENATDIISMNGSTDYLEVYVSQDSGSSVNTDPNSVWIFFSSARLP